MLARNHALSGAAAWLAAAPALVDPTPTALIVGTGIAAGAALAPDLDHHSGTATHAWGPITRVLGWAVGKITGGHRAGTHTLIAVPAAGLVTWAAVTHAGSWPAVAVFALCAALAFIACEDIIPGRWERYWPLNLAGSAAAGVGAVATGMDLTWLPWAVAVGWAAHIAGDMITVGGVPVLMPFTRRRINLTPARAGGSWETPIGWVLTSAIVVLAGLTVLSAPGPWTSIVRDATTTETTETVTEEDAP